MKTPFFGPGYVSRSSNLADDECINLFPEVVETKQGKNVGAFYSTPGLSLLTNCGSGPIWGARALNGVLYVVSGNSVYTVTVVSRIWMATLVGTFSQATPNAAPVSMIDNGTQLAIFTSQGGYILPGGYPLTGGTIRAMGSEYEVGDTIILTQSGGTQTATASLTVSTVNGTGGVTGFAVDVGGAFQTLPTSFSQNSTTGSGAGFTLTFPTFGANVPVYTITLPFTIPVGNTQLISAAQQDGFALINQPSTYVMWQSDELDFSVWNALNFASASGDSDFIVALRQIHLNIFVIKQYETEVWFNAGVSGFTFQRYQTAYPEIGCAAVASVAQSGESLIWLAQNSQGEPTVIMMEGYGPRRISTFAVEYAISQYATISDAIGYAYNQDGHSFYVLTFPTGNATWVYDVTVSELTKIHCWHRRAALSMSVLNRHWGNAFCYFNGTPILGDYQNGNLYEYNTSNLTDNGSIIKRVRRWRALPQSTIQPQRFSFLQLDLQTGIGVPDGTNPQIVLVWSDDGGHTWSNEYIRAAGPPGATAQRVFWPRLGSTRRNSGLDRIFEISTTDQFPAAFIGAELM